MSPVTRSYLIVGAGVFGVSTAYYLIKKYPDASVTIVDRDEYDAESRVAASWDWNKVVRADYDDIVYCKMGLESQDIFNEDPLWKPYFHQTGIYWICRDDYANKVVDNYKTLGRQADLRAVPIEEARKLHGGVFNDADYSGAKAVLVNPTSGWGAAGDCLRAVTKESIKLGVKYVTAEVASLTFDAAGRCTGIKSSNGQSIEAAHVILSTGAFTPKLLEQAAQHTGKFDLRAGDRITAAGITTGMVKLTDNQKSTFASMPVGVQGYTAQTGPFIGSLPPTPDGELKWWGQTIFKNTQEIYPGRHISIPPPKQDYAQWEIPGRLRKDIEHARDVFYGAKSKNWKMEKHRVCWDAFTTSGDFIISPHSAAPGLYVATCGNFHGWKFFPVLGKYVIQMLENTLPSDLAEKWGWDRERPDPSANPDWPRAEMGHILNQTEVAKL